MFKAVIFDMDGVIIDSEPLYYEAWEIVFHKYNFKSSLDEIKQFAGIPIKETIAYFEKKFNVKEEGLLKREQDIVLNHLVETKLKAFDGVEEFIKKLINKNIPISVASSSQHYMINICLGKVDLKKYFRHICSGQDVKNGKPEPDIFLLAAKKMDIRPEDCLVLEDSIAGVKAGKKAGMLVWGHSTTFDSEILIKAGADKTFDNYEKILSVIN